MAGSTYYGKQGYITYGGTTISGMESWSLSIAPKVEQYTTFEGAGYPTTDVLGVDWSGSISGKMLSTYNDGQIAMINNTISGTKATVELYYFTGKKFSGTVVTSLNIESAGDGYVSFSGDFTGDGTLSFV
jgi:hypothetical protein